MARKPISGLTTSYTTLQAGDTMAWDRSGTMGKTTFTELAAEIVDEVEAATATVTGAWTGIGQGLSFIESQDASASATLDFTGFDATKYDAYVFEVGNLVPATDNVSFCIQTSANGGSSYDSGASDYLISRTEIAIGSAAVTETVTSTTIFFATRNAPSSVGVGSAANEDGLTATIRLPHPHLAKRTQLYWSGAYTDSDGNFARTDGAGIRTSSAAVDAVRFFFSSGNIESGTITMYGLRNA